jgi:hypothetical protein
MNKAKERMTKMPKFESEDVEAKWWASGAGREFVKQQSAVGTSRKQEGSPLVARLSRTASMQIALRLPAPDLAKARARREGDRPGRRAG